MKRTALNLIATLAVTTSVSAQVIISDNFNTPSVGSGFALGDGVNGGITTGGTRLLGTAAGSGTSVLRYMNTAGGKADSAFLIGGNARLRVNNATGNGRITFSADGTTAFNFNSALGIGGASPTTPIEYDIKLSMDNNASGTHRMSFGIGTIESDATTWDFGLQLHKSNAANDFYTVSKRIDTGSSGLGADRNDSMISLGAGSAGSEVSFVIRVTDAGAETGTFFNSRVRVSDDGGSTWFYDTDADSALVNGFRFDGAGRYFSFDVAGGNSSFVTYDGFSVEIVPEPSTFALAGLGGAALLFFRRRFKNAAK